MRSTLSIGSRRFSSIERGLRNSKLGTGERRFYSIGARAVVHRALLARRKLRLAEVILALGVGYRAAPRSIGQYGNTALHRRPRRESVVPTFDGRIVGEIDVPPLRAQDPGEEMISAMLYSSPVR
jgi:hypothetical protein